jgi:hypothetical protein
MLRPADLDLQHLRALSICHYVLGGLAAIYSILPLFYVGMGILMIFYPGTMSGGSGPPPPAAVGWMLILMGSGGALLIMTFSVLVIIAGRFLVRRKHRIYCIVMAGVSCANVPLGTVLGVFTLIVLLRPSVKRLFEMK